MAHWAFLNAHDAEELDLMLPKVIACYATMLLGGILYVSKSVPDRPKKTSICAIAGPSPRQITCSLWFGFFFV